MVPSKLRNRAKARCQHLGLSYLDIGSENDARPVDPDAEPMWELPSTLRDRPMAKVSSILDKANRIRLDALTEHFLGPLQELLGTKRYLLSERQPSSLDCLAMGYLCLFLLPELPQPWLAEKMGLNFGRLCEYVDNLRKSFYIVPPDSYSDPGADKDTGAADASFTEKHLRVREALPWANPSITPRIKTHSALLDNALDLLPFIKQFRAAARLRKSFSKQTAKDSTTDLDSLDVGRKGIRFIELAAITIGLSVAVSYLFSISPLAMLQRKEPEPEQQSLDDLGEAGAALAVLARQMDRPAQTQESLE